MINVVIGTRPNFVKIAPLLRAIKKYENIKYKLIHTGQHYDAEMSKVFFEDLEIPQPDICLDVGSGSHTYQLATIMTKFEQVCLDDMPDMVMVVGDVNSTLACALVASRLPCKLVHVEAGLRSFDLKMPEETNRIITDRLSNYLFAISSYDKINLNAEGIYEGVHVVGNVMVDSLLYNLPKIRQIPTPDNDYILFTLHRAGTVDNKITLGNVLDTVITIRQDTGIDVIFPVHPRTRRRIEAFGLNSLLSEHEICVTKPKSYLEILALIKNAKVVITDSGGIQVEAMVLKTPCLTLRDKTEHIETLTENLGGTNRLVGVNATKTIEEAERILKLKEYSVSIALPKLYDGHAADRIMAILSEVI